MADVDPNTFLRSAKPQSNEAALYDAKKWLWVPDENAGFIAGEVKEQTGDTVTIELNSGQVQDSNSLFFPIEFFMTVDSVIFFPRRSLWTSMTPNR